MGATVTIIMPAYNAAPYLAESIESVLAQTFQDFELLIIDDGSQDNTAEIARQYCEKDYRVKLFSQPNQGVSNTRNKGIKMAKGEYIAFFDADDLWMPEKLAAHIEHFKSSSELGLSFARVEFMTFDGKPTGQFSNSRLKNIQPEYLYYENLVITPSNAVIRSRVFEEVEGFDKNLSGTEDADLFLRVKCQGWNVEGINRVLVRYRTSLAGVSSNLDRMEEDWNRFSNKVKLYAPELFQQHYNRAEAVFLRYLARRAFRLRLTPQIGVDFINRALRADWQLILREPKRTLLTMLAVYGSQILNFFRYPRALNQSLQK
ncbi:MAG: glycosyltransferase family A protein [Nostocaceae cyanobacterium]|nr:glycosyltransferase family A protein [Nostocaceae cyanobacterium]